MESADHIFRGKGSKLLVEDFRLNEKESPWMKYQVQAEQMFENAKSEMEPDMFSAFCDAVGTIAKNYEFGYNEEDDLNEECEGTQCSDIAEKKDQEVGNLQKPKKPKKHFIEMFKIPKNHGFKGFRLDESGHYTRGNYILINENGTIKAINKKLLEDNLGRYGELIISSEEADVRAKELCTALNAKMNLDMPELKEEPLYNFEYRLEEDMIKIFDTNECFDYEAEEYTSGEINKIVQKYFGPMAYLEPENSVIFTICDVIIEN